MDFLHQAAQLTQALSCCDAKCIALLSFLPTSWQGLLNFLIPTLWVKDAIILACFSLPGQKSLQALRRANFDSGTIQGEVSYGWDVGGLEREGTSEKIWQPKPILSTEPWAGTNPFIGHWLVSEDRHCHSRVENLIPTDKQYKWIQQAGAEQWETVAPAIVNMWICCQNFTF